MRRLCRGARSSLICDRIVLSKFCKVVSTVYPVQIGIREGEMQFEQCINHREIWDNLSSIKPIDVEKIVLPFLNKWRCRLSYVCVSNLAVALQKAEQWLSPLRRLSIEDLDITKSVQNANIGSSPFAYIEKAFKTIQEVPAKQRTVGFTATSKILHMAIPDLFVMCDVAIRDKYGCAANTAGYINFMLRMNLIALDLISQTNGNKQSILNCSKWPGRTLARLLDNYNYTMFTLNKQTMFP
jgi:hypothetical protein